jgi:hypothetical protein
MKRTKSNPALMMEMIALYLEQTPTLISTMKLSWQNKDWGLLQSSMHKLIPSFSIMGISVDVENMAKELKEFALSQKRKEIMPGLLNEIERVCIQACIELKEEFELIEKNLLSVKEDNPNSMLNNLKV